MTPPINDSIKRLQDAYLMFPAFQQAFQKMEDNLKLYRTTGVARNLLIIGESGTGKTTLSRIFTDEHPTVALAERDRIPVLCVPVPAAATIAGTVEAVLSKLGDPAPERGTVSVKTGRAVKIAKGCGVEMLMFDEAQHIQDRGRINSQYFVGDWMKSFADSLGLPVTLFGLPRTECLLQVNEQLRRRFTHRLSLSTITNDDLVDDRTSLDIFSSLVSVLPLQLNPGPFGWRELGSRLRYACDGRIAYLKQLLASAFSLALDKGQDQIGRSELADAFVVSIWANGLGQLNPFNVDFVFRRLDRAGEPFQIADIRRPL